ncbi:MULTISPECIES: PepSY-like domain-containing protein [unclassified Arcicella]|uniref:PepSY-like domain-containing protein n=1 Tax=unclassified Arcicella TaxID=2644986 RepID=UPI00285F3152|nr:MULTISPECIES: PepSY-like domain-containing protein [unclassified Arcicella]MDR6561351.1 guanyl-specific ribonuclease Sa [Arcicella sp. BE51]MDR6811235.1 guanyl-specific ribonuclease Sa [Arcicella sp. BE140]MDR6822585.1 guanyl-specific ribonuclease Sa [Arcicella sp. BE139]
MKKLMFIMTAFIGVMLASCSKQEDLSASDDNYSALEVSAARTAAVTDTVTKQKCKGNITSIDPAALPATITTYISTNYAGATIKYAGKDAQGQYVVGVSLNNVETGLLFDANGVFVKALQHYARKAKLTEVDITTLPATLTSYITTNYAGYTVKRAGKDADGNIYVAISDGTNRKVLLFDATGAFKQALETPLHKIVKLKKH